MLLVINNIKSASRRFFLKFEIYLALAFPLFLIFFVYLSNRSLFLDSLNLARNVNELSFKEFLGPLKYQQSAPFLFLVLSKVSIWIMGCSEYSLRIIPLLSALGSLGIFAVLAKRIFSSGYVFVAITWLGTHSLFIRYASEYKQYITDLLVTLLIVLVALKTKRLDWKNVIPIALFGTGMIWLSMPSVFVLAAMLVLFTFRQLKSSSPLLPVFTLIVIFAANFYMEYNLIISSTIKSEQMQNFHQPFFLQGEFWNLKSLSHDIGLFISIIAMVVGKSGLAISMALILILISVYNALKFRKSEFLLIIITFLATFSASLISKYSIVERLMLFSFPLIIITMVHGLSISLGYLAKNNKWWSRCLVFAISFCLILGFIHKQGFKYLIHPLELEDNRSALYFIQKTEQSLPIICTHLALPAIEYYTKYDFNKKHFCLGEIIPTAYNTDISALAFNYAKESQGPVWILAGHLSEPEIDELFRKLNAVGRIKNSHRNNHSAATLFLLNSGCK